jgi:hypothetical protein
MPLLSLRLRFVAGVLFVLVAFAAPLSAGPITLDFEDLRTESTLESVVGLTYSYEGFTVIAVSGSTALAICCAQDSAVPARTDGGAFNLRSIGLIESPSLNSDLTPVDLGPASLWPKP